MQKGITNLIKDGIGHEAALIGLWNKIGVNAEHARCEGWNSASFGQLVIF